MSGDSGAVTAAIFAMAAATYAMRAGGFWLMGHVPLTPRVERMLAALPGAVIVATIVPILAHEGIVAAIAIAAAIVAAAIKRNDFLVLIVGVGAAALARAAGIGS